MSGTGATDATNVAPPVTRRGRRRYHRLRTLVEWALVLAVAFLVSELIRDYAFQTFYIPSPSMEPTLLTGDRILVSKLGVELGTVHIGDVIVFHHPPAEQCSTDSVEDLVKRVIGVPGDHLTSVGNTIFVNGHPLRENWPHVEPLGRPIGSVTVPAGSYFVMGDNHPDSCDSRYWGTVPRSLIIGKVVMILWPASRISAL